MIIGRWLPKRSAQCEGMEDCVTDRMKHKVHYRNIPQIPWSR